MLLHKAIKFALNEQKEGLTKSQSCNIQYNKRTQCVTQGLVLTFICILNSMRFHALTAWTRCAVLSKLPCYCKLSSHQLLLCLKSCFLQVCMHTSKLNEDT